MSKKVAESNYPPGWQNVQYRWDLAWANIRARDLVRTLGRVGRVGMVELAARANTEEAWLKEANRG